MKRLGLLITGLTFSILSYGQVIKIQGGTSLSKLDWQISGLDLGQYNEPLVGYVFFIGLDYLDKEYFNLSSSCGLIRKGGKDEELIVAPSEELSGETMIEKAILDYFSVNTMIDLKYPVKETFLPFISIGPRLDYLVNNSKTLDSLDEIHGLNVLSLGLTLGCGVKYELLKFQIGLRTDYYLNFTKIADWSASSLNIDGEVNNNMFSISLTFGYKLH